MAMRMPPQAAQTPLLPAINRTGLVFFGGTALVVVNLLTTNPGAVIPAIFQSQNASGAANTAPLSGVFDAALQELGIGILSILAEYGGDGAGTFAVVFVGALWLLWLVTRGNTLMGGLSEKKPAGTSGSGTVSGGGHGGVK